MTAKEMKRAKVDAGQPKTFLPKIEEFYGEHRKFLTDALAVICAASSDVGMRLDAENVARLWCDESLAKLLDASGCSVGELPTAVEACVSDWNSGRVKEFVAMVQPKKKRGLSC